MNNSLKKKWQKPVMAMERFVANEYITGCDFKWKYQGTPVPGEYVCEGTYNSNYDFWYVLRGWQGGDTQHNNDWDTDEDVTFYTNDESLGDELGNPSNYSGDQGESYYAGGLSWKRDFILKDGDVYKYTYGGKVYYSADKFTKKRNYS